MNTLRSLVFAAWMYGLLVVMGTLWLPSLLMPRGVLLFGMRLYVRLVRAGLHGICGVRTELRGLEHLPDGPVLYAGKHQCMWDVYVPFLMRPDPAIILKRELLWYPFFGWYALKLKMLPIDRAGAARTLKSMVAAAKARVAAGRDILIFPEGTRRSPGADPAYQAAGVSALYRDLGVPCVPVATNSGLCWPGRGLTRRPGVIVYEVLPAIPPGLDRKAFLAHLKDELEPASQALLAEGLAVQGRAPGDLESET